MTKIKLNDLKHRQVFNPPAQGHGLRAALISLKGNTSGIKNVIRKPTKKKKK